MNADLARKRARQQNSRTHALRLDPSWETNPESTTLLWTCQTCEGLSLPPPWLVRTNEKCAAGKPTDHKGKTRARPLLVRQGLRACVRLCLAVPLPQARQTDRQTDRHRHRESKQEQQTKGRRPQKCGKRDTQKALVDRSAIMTRRLCIRSLLCLRSNLLCCACSLRMTLLGPGRQCDDEGREMSRQTHRNTETETMTDSNADSDKTLWQMTETSTHDSNQVRPQK